jgi:hypothetical protein
MALMNKGINLVFLDNPTVCTDYVEQLASVAKKQELIIRKSIENIIELLLIVELDRVEKERAILIQRIRHGIAASDKRQGRKAGQVDKMTDALRADIREYIRDRRITQKSVMERHGISRNTLKKYIQLLRSS